MQCVTPDIGMAFQVVEDALQYIFLPDLFQGSTEQIPGREINSIPVKQAGISLPNPTQTAVENWTASCVIMGHLVAALQGTAEFRSGNHAPLVGEEREEIQHRHTEEADNALGEAWDAASKLDARRLGRIQRAGEWMSVPSSTFNGTELGDQEWR